jgi:hypothetical protein
MLSRTVEADGGGIAAAPRLAPDLADESLRIAHGLLIIALGAQVDHFQVDSGPLVAKLDQDFGEIWRKGEVENQSLVVRSASCESSRQAQNRINGRWVRQVGGENRRRRKFSNEIAEIW